MVQCTHGRECLNDDSRGPDGFNKSIDGTWTMASRANQKIASFYVITIDDSGIAEQYGRIDSSVTYRITDNIVHQAFVAGAIEEDFHFQ